VDRSHYRKRTVGELTARQHDVLALMAQGKTNREIGEALGISLDGAKFHVSEILATLGVDSREEAVAWWRQRGAFRMRATRIVRGLMTVSAFKWTAGAAGLAVAGVVIVVAVAANGGDDGGSAQAEPTDVGMTSSPSLTPSAPGATRVIHYAPEAGAGAPEVDGSCFVQSLAAPWRTDAWRCSTSDARVYDPCFWLNGASVLCGTNPVKGEAGLVLRLQQSSVPLGDVVRDPGGNGWLLRLAGGTMCIPATGASGSIEGKRANYLCSDGRWLLGDLEPGTVWKADAVELRPASAVGAAPTVASRETVAIETVWQ
jgi:DNA-binding CsgD family transcriptional regulator